MNIYVIHGYTANTEANWFPWLKKEVEKNLNQQITILAMPNPNVPVVEDWDVACDEQIARKDGITIVGHSLGCVTALRFLSRHEVKNVNLILGSGFDETTYTLPQLNAFTRTPVDYSGILQKINSATVVSAFDDDIVPYTY